MSRLRTALLALIATAFLAPTSATAAPPFAPDSFWNTPLAADAPLDSRSTDYVAEIQRQLTVVPPYINTTRYSTPVYTVPSTQARVLVKLDSQYAEPDLRSAWQDVPMPANAIPAEGTDGHVVVHQPSTDTMWEFWRVTKEADGWHADWGGKMTNVSSNPGFFTTPQNWGATATSLPLLGGLIRLDELQAGRIDHALALAIPDVKKGSYSWPAQRSDGAFDDPNAIPEGTRFRIDPSLNLDTIQMAPVVRMIAEAAQRYGIVLRDKAGSVTFFAEDPTPTGTNPYAGPTGWFLGKSAATLMQQFPWARLQALQTNLRSGAPLGSVYVTATGVLNVSTTWNVSSNLKVEDAGTGVKVTDPAGLDAVGSRCTQVDGTTVTCTGATSAKLSGSHKSDTIRMLASLPSTISGGATGDHIYGGPRGDTLDGDAGPDMIYPGLGADRVNGGDGNDRADYGTRTSALTLSLDGVANDGQLYERDNLATDIEVLVAGSGNDTLIGGPEANSLWAQDGNDVVDGRGGADWINGGAGTDTADYSTRTKPVTLSPGDSLWNDGEAGEGDGISPDIERLVGGWAGDTLLGSGAAEVLEGREGNDTLDGGLGADVLRGAGGTDAIASRDLLVDTVDCGGSKDKLVGDLIDLLIKKSDCESRSLL